MVHQGTQTLYTQRLILRRFVPEDAQAVFQNWASDNEVTRYLSWPTHASEGITCMVLEDWVRSYEKPDFYTWAIQLDGQPVGSISVVALQEETMTAEIGYCIGRRWWHQGITAEALKAVVDYLFDIVGVRRIQARHDTRNPNSGAVMRKCGMKLEGTLRQSDRNNQGICDTCIYGLLDTDRQKQSVP